MSPRTNPILWCLLSAALFGVATPLAKPLTQSVGPTLLAGLLYTGAAAFTLPRVVRAGRWRRASNRSWLYLAGAAMFGGILGPIALLSGLLLAPAGAVSLWLTLETAATAVLARAFFKESLGNSGWAAVALVSTGSVLLSDSLDAGVGAGLVALACLCWGLDNNLTSLIDEFSPDQTTLIKGLTTGATLIPIGLAFDQRATIGEVSAALSIGALSYGLSLVLYVAGAQQLGATRSQLVFSSAPLFGLLPSVWLLEESLSWVHGAAAALMATGTWLAHRSDHAHPHVHHPLEHDHAHRHDDDHHQHTHRAEDPPPQFGWHSHHHSHPHREHDHPHQPDLHHRHAHND